jgi:gliding motility-associated-like protein
VYNNPGTYNAFLVVTSNRGCVDTTTKVVTVYPTPNVQFLVNDSSGCQNFCTQFSDLSTISSGSITSWIWNFGDNSVFSTIQNTSHCYPNSGIYTISLTATSNNNCSATHTEVNLINVFPTAVADFTYSPQPITTNNSNVTFINLSQQSSMWWWNFGDPVSANSNYSSLNSPEHFYSYMGDYCVTLIASNIYNCADTTVQCLRVDPVFTFYIPNSFTPNHADGTNDLFSGKGTNIKTYEMWIFDRWGDMIFYTDDIEKGWNGKANNGKDIAQVDVYVYKVILYDFSETMHEYIGRVSLVR